MSTSKTVIVAPAIKTHFWEDLYGKFSKDTVPFHMVFVGHILPNFDLPSNFTHIECNLSASACAEIAYRYAYEHIKDAKYIINVADDMGIPNIFLSDLIDFYNLQVEKYKTELLMAGNMYLNSVSSENFMGIYNNGPCLLGPALTTIKNSKKIGGIDKRFKAIYWDCDRHLRTQMLGGRVVFATADELSPVWEIEQNPGGLLHTYASLDKTMLDGLWSYEELSDSPKVTCSLNNKVVLNNLTLTRLSSVEEYSEEEIGSWYE